MGAQQRMDFVQTQGPLKGKSNMQREVVTKIVTLKRNFGFLEGIDLQKEALLQGKITPLAEVSLGRKAALKRMAAQQKGVTMQRGEHLQGKITPQAEVSLRRKATLLRQGTQLRRNLLYGKIPTLGEVRFQRKATLQRGIHLPL